MCQLDVGFPTSNSHVVSSQWSQFTQVRFSCKFRESFGPDSHLNWWTGTHRTLGCKHIWTRPNKALSRPNDLYKDCGSICIYQQPMYIKAALNEMKIWSYSRRGRHRLGLCWFKFQHLAKKKIYRTDFQGGIRYELKWKYIYVICTR